MLALLITIPISFIKVVWCIKIVYITPGVMYRNCLYHSILVWSNVIVYITPGVMHRFCLYHSILVWSSRIVYITPSWSDASKLFISHHWYFMSLKKFHPWWDSNPWPLVLEARSILSELPGLHVSTLNYHPVYLSSKWCDVSKLFISHPVWCTEIVYITPSWCDLM